MSSKTLPQIVNDVFVSLEPLGSEDRQKVVGSVMTLLGETVKMRAEPQVTECADNDSGDIPVFGTKAGRWMKQNGLTSEMLEEIFHVESGQVEIIASEVPGKSKKAQSKNCYLLAGAKALLATDDPKFEDSDALELCKHVGCHDQANHASTRNDLGKFVTGTKNSGFTLPAPGLRAAAELIKQMSP